MSNNERKEYEELKRKNEELKKKRSLWSKNWREKNGDKVRKYSLDYSKRIRDFYKKFNGKVVTKEMVGKKLE